MNLDAAIQLHVGGDLNGAERGYRLVISQNPNSDVAHGNLGVIYMSTGRAQEGIELIQLALRLNPGNHDTHVNLGVALFNQGDLEAAASSYRRALKLNPSYPLAHNNLGNVLSAQGHLEGAALSYCQALEVKPDYAEAHYNLGNVLREQGKLEDAVHCYKKAVERRANYFGAYNNLGLVLAAQNQIDDAMCAHHKALEAITVNLESTSLVPKLAGLLVELERIPIIYGQATEITRSREHYIACLRQASLLASNSKGDFSAEERSILRQLLFRISRFYLAYQQLDDRELQVVFCRLATTILNPEIGDYLTLNRDRRSDSRIRLGIASEVLKDHNGAYWAYNWLANLPPEDYQFFLYSLNGETDGKTQKFAQLGTYRWLPFTPHSYLQSLQVIKNDNLDVLLLPDVGMTASSRIVSLLRLAPVQCVGWGHPVTTGSPNIDYYLSSELMETGESDSHYSEQLIKLPNIGLHIEQPAVPADVLDRTDFGLPENRIIYGAVQTVFKYLPQFDFVYPAIAQQVPNAHFVFVGNQSDRVTADFQQRLKNSFEQSGIDFKQHVTILPWMPLERFMQLLGVLDVYLDSIGFSGGITAMRSLAVDCPVVTLPGEFMRGRLAYAMLKMIGLEELIARSLDDYISLASEIGRDSKLRFSLVAKIKAAKHKLFNDTECVAYLDKFFKTAVGHTREQDNSGQSLNLNAAIELYLGGDLDGAERVYRQVISQDPNNDVASGNLAVICLRTGRWQESIELLQLSLRLNPNNPKTHLNMGVALKELGDADGALDNYHKAVELDPNYAEAFSNIGLVLTQRGESENAISCFDRAVALKPDYAGAYFNLGNVFLAQGKPADAISSYRSALNFQPGYVDAWLNVGIALFEHGQLDEAISSYGQALELSPQLPEAYLNLANALAAQGKLDDAVLFFGRALGVRPNFAEAYNNLGLALREQGKLDDATASLRMAAQLKPDFAQAHSNLGLALMDQNKLDDAVSSFGQALEIRTANIEPQSWVRNLGRLLNELGRIPILYQDATEIQKCREHYAHCLDEAALLACNPTNIVTSEERGILREILFRINNFYLAYQQRNDLELQTAYARLASNILNPEINTYLTLNKAGRFDSKIRLGIASELLKNHNGSFWAYGWLSSLPRHEYEFFVYSLNGTTDHFTRKFAELGTYRWLPFKHHNYLRSVEVIAQDNLDVLLLPDVGMTASSRIISLLRLAPIQCACWGHPVTTGSPNIDYYLTSELMETESSASHYSEKLLRLPNLGMHFDFPELPQEILARADFGIPEGKIVYGAMQSLFKYLPQFDFLYPAIAKGVPDALFVFVGSESAGVTAVFQERLKRSFEQSGLSFENHVQILPRMNPSRFMQLLSVLDIFLDSIGWNGGITTLCSLSLNCPVVTLPGQFMRGRHSYAMLKMIGARELVAHSLDDYISLACKIGLDGKLRSSLVQKIEAAKHKLFNDTECVAYLDKFFKRQVGNARQQDGRG